jgi:sterol-4alpha-carboxylate 3-dehydrogenase (decarboxylating)
METPISEKAVLILGGCGFVGFHIVNHFVKDQFFSSVAVVSRSAANSTIRVDGATYHEGDLKNQESIRRVIDQIKPCLIINAACPSPVTGTPKEYDLVTVKGTKCLLKLAQESKDVRALIYISSSTLAKGAEHLKLTEDYPLANTDPKSSAYARTKALAEISVLKANKPFPIDRSSPVASWTGYLLTSALRFPIVYGTHDPVGIPACLNVLQKGQTNVQSGDGKNLWSFCSAHNACVATSILARRLLGITDVPESKLNSWCFPAWLAILYLMNFPHRFIMSECLIVGHMLLNES